METFPQMFANEITIENRRLDCQYVFKCVTTTTVIKRNKLSGIL